MTEKKERKILFWATLESIHEVGPCGFEYNLLQKHLKHIWKDEFQLNRRFHICEATIPTTAGWSAVAGWAHRQAAPWT